MKFIAGFIGEANLVPCEAEQGTDGMCNAMVEHVSVKVRDNGLRGPATLVNRPEATTLSGADAQGGLKGVVTSVSYLGDRVYYGVATPLEQIFHIEHTSSVRHPRTSDVTIHFDASKLKVVK